MYGITVTWYTSLYVLRQMNNMNINTSTRHSSELQINMQKSKGTLIDLWFYYFDRSEARALRKKPEQQPTNTLLQTDLRSLKSVILYSHVSKHVY